MNQTHRSTSAATTNLVVLSGDLHAARVQELLFEVELGGYSRYRQPKEVLDAYCEMRGGEITKDETDPRSNYCEPAPFTQRSGVRP